MSELRGIGRQRTIRFLRPKRNSLLMTANPGITAYGPAGLALLCSIMMIGNRVPMQAKAAISDAVAIHIDHDIALDARNSAPEWKKASPVTFELDWQGRNQDPGRLTEVRLLWSAKTLYLRFECRYRELFLFDGSDPNGRRDHLWDRDVAEAFLQPDPARPFFYKEFEVSPNGMWIDLDIFPGGRSDLNSGVQRSVFLDERSQMWTAELAIPMKSLTAHLDPGRRWRCNFFRVEGRREPRSYMAWRSTGTPQPDFHVPARFGDLRFEK